MRRSFRILFYGAAAISLLLCVASGLLWVRSYGGRDIALWAPAGRADRGYGYYSVNGHLILRRGVINLPVGIKQASWDAVPFDTLPVCVYRGWIDADSWHGFAWYTTSFTGPRINQCGYGIILSGYWNEMLLPYWFVVCGAGALPAVVVYRRLRRVRKRPGCCAQCGYDLRATPGRCPECGTIPVTATPAAPPGGP